MGAQRNASEELSCQWAGPGQGSHTAEWYDFCNPSPRQSKTQKPRSAVDGHLISLVPLVAEGLGSAVSLQKFHPCLKADRSASGNNKRRPIWLLPHVPTQSRYEGEEGISSHHSQETRDKRSRVLQIRSFLLQSILHPEGRQFPYELNFPVLSPLGSLVTS